MTFKLLTNSYTLGFNYRAAITQMEYSGQTVVTNPHTAPEIYGSFLSSTPTCGMTDSLANIRAWFGSTNGTLVQFHVFKEMTLVSGNYRVTGVCLDAAGNLGIQTWQLNSSAVWVKQPYLVTCAVPVTVTTPGVSINSQGKLVGAAIGGQVTGTFGFRIVPVDNNFKYNRTGVEEIPFKVVPFGGLLYSNV